MSAQDERLRQALKTFHATDFTTIAATVLEVDAAALTVDVQPLDGGAEIFGVTCQGGASYSFSLVLWDGTVLTTATSPGAISVAIGSLTAQQLTNGYDIQIEYTGTANVASAVLQTYLA